MTDICVSLERIANRCTRGLERACKTESGIAKLILATSAAAFGTAVFAAIIGASAPGVIFASAIVGIGVFAKVCYDYGAPIGGFAKRVRNHMEDHTRDARHQVRQFGQEIVNGTEEFFDEVGRELDSAADALFGKD